MQKAWHKYDARYDHKPTTMRQAFEWAVADGLLELPEVDPYDLGAEQMANAVRAETRTDPQGRRYRVNHAVRVTKSGVQYTFWGTLGFAPVTHMHKSYGQRRNMVVDDLFQLKTDVDVFNGMVEEKRQQYDLGLNFENDIAEREEIERMQNRRKDVA
ncbi:MAG TPA: hypothetical protein VMH20_15050 [Verrucomicrobiae bacterium]|nr:hypothetical protein [Verrucomicrobiae bacterium]